MPIRFLVVAIWLTVGQPPDSVAASLQPIELTEVLDHDGLFLGQRVAVWENQKRFADPEAVFGGQLDANFHPATKDFPGPAYIKGELWLRLVIRSQEAQPMPLVVESRYALTDFISLYQKDSSGLMKVATQGDRYEQRQDRYPFRSPAFQIMVYPGDNVYYLRTESRGPNILSLYLWQLDGFRGHRFVDTLILGGLFGFIFALFIYNGFLAISFRSRTYTYYSIFLLSMILLQASMQNVWPYLVAPKSASWLDNEGYLFIGTATNLLAIMVTTAFLYMKKNLPRFLRFFHGLLILSLCPIVAGLVVSFDTQARLISITIGVGALAIIVASVIAMLQGYRPAFYYLLASLSFLIANILLALNLLGVYHAPHVIQYGNFVGVVLEGLLMSLAIGDRVQFIRSSADKVIRKLNQELQHHLTQVEAQVAERTETIRTILDNVASGFVMVSPEGKVLEGFSRSCHQLLDRSVREGQLFVDLLNLNPSTRKLWMLAWQQVFQDLLPIHVSLAQLPSLVQQGQRSLRLECKPLRDEQGRIKNLLFSIQDVTELKRKQRESRRNRTLIKILRDLEAFRQFINHSFEFVARLKVCSDKREQAFLLHTLKGNSRVFGLNSVAQRLHQLEESRHLTPQDIQAIENLFRRFLSAHEAILKTPWGTSHQEARVTQSQLRRLEDLAAKSHDPLIQGDIEGWIGDVLARPVGILVQPIIDSCRIMARRLEKNVQIEVLGAHVRVRSQREEKTLEFLVHIIRNAIIHGLESDRAAFGKSAEGLIQLEFSESAESLRISCRDDGQGFDRQYWEERARLFTGRSEHELRSLSWLELVELVSRGGHSTQKNISLDAGRGVGMEGIIHAVRELGGRLHLESETGRGSCIHIEIQRQTTHQAA